MKKIIVSSLAVLGLALSGYSQGVITFDGSSAAGHVSINGVLDTVTDINAELLYFNGASFAPVVTLLLSASTGLSGNVAYGSIQPAAGDIQFDGDGTLYDNSGNTYFGASPALTVVTFEVQGWTGSYASLALAQAGGAAVGTTASFVETLSSASSPINAACDQMPNLNLVSTPEPATMALAGLGLASMLAFRRRK